MAHPSDLLYTFIMLVYIIILLIIILLLILYVIFSGIVAHKVYTATLVRTSPEKWGRCCSAPENEEHFRMWNKGLEWAEANKDSCCEVWIENDGFNLCGEYFDFGADRAVIIIPGRSESLMYSYYFAIPYEKAGCNVLVIDIRSHGRSDGKYDYFGVGEDIDTMKWAALLHEKFGNKKVLIHGICMGASTGIQILVRPDCPEYIAGQISEGCYISFYESFKQHMIQRKRPLYPVLPMVMGLIKIHTGVDVGKTRPIDFIQDVKQPFLMLCGRKDLSSLPKRSQELFDKCGSGSKEIVWFEDGVHSHLRIANEEAFDRAIIDFIHKYFD